MKRHGCEDLGNGASRSHMKSLHSDMAVLEAVRHYAAMGWSPIPIPHRSKAPVLSNWSSLRLTGLDLSAHFSGWPQNVGILLGEPSNWLVDVDLDHPRCVALAMQHLPPTPTIFGRVSKPRSHWIYRVTRPVSSKRHRSKTAGMLVELRSTGLQTVFPPSTHVSGEAIDWEQRDAEPASLDPSDLLDAVKRLADAVLAELDESPVREISKPSVGIATNTTDTLVRVNRCIAAMWRIQIIDQKDGSSRLFAAACRAVEHDLDDSSALCAIHDYARQHPFPIVWPDDQILLRIRDAEKCCTRGAAFLQCSSGLLPLGTCDPVSRRVVLSPRMTLPTVQSFVAEFFNHPQGRTLHSYAGSFLEWRKNRYVPLDDQTLCQRLQPWLHQALRYVSNPVTRSQQLTEFESNPTTVNAAVESLRSYVHLETRLAPPSWLIDRPEQPSPADLLPCRGGNLHLPTGRLLPATPTLFNTCALDFDYDPEAPPPLCWLQFLDQLWGTDLESIQLLQEWIGYCLVPDTSQQKILLLFGPKRSGKGTIGRLIRRLVSGDNVAGPTTSSLAGPFGLQPLIGKSLAIVSDARFRGESVGVVVERLLCISGEDALTIDRKFACSVTLKLPTRFMFLTNELPRMIDASGALAARFMMLRLTRSFYGDEDTALSARLCEELPGILRWAVEGLQQLRRRGHFVQPGSAQQALQDLENLGSPVLAFLRSRCSVASGQRVEVDELYVAWCRWCAVEGTPASTRQAFGKDLTAAVPGLMRRRGTGNVGFYMGLGLRSESNERVTATRHHRAVAIKHATGEALGAGSTTTYESTVTDRFDLPKSGRVCEGAREHTGSAMPTVATVRSGDAALHEEFP